MTQYCGIDLHSNNHVVVVINEEHKRVYEKRSNNDLNLTLAAHVAHGKALDFGIAHINTSYVLCIHTDTLIHDAGVLELMIDTMQKNSAVAVGTVDQLHRHAGKRLWRLFNRAIRYYGRYIGRKLKLTDKFPSPYREKYLKSYCCLWNVEIIKSNGLLFNSDNRNPSYTMQDKFKEAGFVLIKLPTATIFKYLDHIQSGTMVEIGLHRQEHRRSRAYRRLIRTHLEFGGHKT